MTDYPPPTWLLAGRFPNQHIPAPARVVMDEDERRLRLALALAAERQATERRARDRLLRELTSRPEPAHDVAGALARLAS